MKKMMSTLVAVVLAASTGAFGQSYKTVPAYVASATETVKIIPERANQQIIVRTLEATGDNAACVIKWRLPQPQYRYASPAAITNAAAIVRVPSDALGGVTWGGHTVTGTNDFLLVPGPTGWLIKTISTVAAAATNSTYMNVTIAPALTAALASNAVCYVVTADDVASFPVVGASTISRRDVVAGGVGAPVLMGVVSTATNSLTVGAVAEYVR